jgi:hypothetical protein
MATSHSILVFPRCTVLMSSGLSCTRALAPVRVSECTIAVLTVVSHLAVGIPFGQLRQLMMALGNLYMYFNPITLSLVQSALLSDAVSCIACVRHGVREDVRGLQGAEAVGPEKSLAFSANSP